MGLGSSAAAVWVDSSTFVAVGRLALAVAALLRTSGLLGAAGEAGRLPRHRCLFCTTDVGRVALARQLAAEVHVEASGATAAELRRFGTAVTEPVDEGVFSAWVSSTWGGGAAPAPSAARSGKDER